MELVIMHTLDGIIVVREMGLTADGLEGMIARGLDCAKHRLLWRWGS